MSITLYRERDLRVMTKPLFAILKKGIMRLLPDAEVEEIGSTAVPGCLTKGDVDLLVRVAPSDFDAAVEALMTLHQLNHDMDDIEHFASFRGEREGVAYGIQLTVRNSDTFHFLAFRDLLRQCPDMVDDYNELKQRNCHLPADTYRAKKHKFIESALSCSA